MADLPIIRTDDRNIWRKWLSENYTTTTEVWLSIPLKASGEKGISYNDAVEEALCFGWIDSNIRPSDSLHRIQRFTPRRQGSTYSRLNIERLIWLNQQGMLMPEVLESVRELLETPYEFPKDILEELSSDESVWSNFCGFTESYKRIRIAYIDAARDRPDEFRKRFDNFIAKTKAGKIITGYGGTDKYY